MIVLNGTERTQRNNVSFTRSVTPQLDNTRSSSCIRKKKLNDERYIFKVFGIRGAQHLR